MFKKVSFTVFMAVIMIFNTIGNSVLAETTPIKGEEECECCSSNEIVNPKGVTGEQKGELKDAHVMQDFRDFVRELPEYASNYKFNDFKWNEAQYTLYDELHISNVQVPYKDSTKDEQKYLVFNYHNETTEITSPIILDIEKTGEEQGLITYKTLDDVSIAKIELGNDSDGSLVMIQSEDAGYWSCVQKCLEDSWDAFPEWVKWTCSAGCGGCLFGANIWGCSACVGCLGGFALGCTSWCAFN